MLEDSREAASKLQVQLVAILGVFAAIVVAFSAGSEFLKGTLTTMGDASIYEATFFIALCGLVLFNMVALLMHYVAEIVGSKNPKFKLHSSGKDRSYVRWFNAVLIALMAIALFSWYVAQSIWPN
jgi:hypothetical protein